MEAETEVVAKDGGERETEVASSSSLLLSSPVAGKRRSQASGSVPSDLLLAEKMSDACRIDDALQCPDWLADSIVFFPSLVSPEVAVAGKRDRMKDLKAQAGFPKPIFNTQMEVDKTGRPIGGHSSSTRNGIVLSTSSTLHRQTMLGLELRGITMRCEGASFLTSQKAKEKGVALCSLASLAHLHI